MNKNDYISAMQHVKMSEEFKAETLKKLAETSTESGKKPIYFKKYIMAAACVLIMLAAPIAIGSYSKLNMAKSASPMAAPQDRAIQSAPAAAESPMLSGAAMAENADGGAGEKADLANEKAALNSEEFGAAAENAQDVASPTAALDHARELVLNGSAYKETADKTGGYNIDALEIISEELLTDEANGKDNIFKFTVREKNADLPLTLYVALDKNEWRVLLD
ncbi:MAG: hypothetical protein RSC96_02860, partial [Oscillospiraceae bacterium]